MRVIFCLFFVSYSVFATDTLRIQGVQKPVEIFKDKWGINHIFAQTEADLFFAQGYMAASDRLFQLELWRRQATGTVAELLGKRELKRDIGTRLFKFRGNIDTELNHYHPHGGLIVRSFVAGINAYISSILKTPDQLPIEFKILHTTPQLWTPEVVISRHQGILANIKDELNFGRLVHLIGEKKLKELAWFHPGDPNIKLDASLKPEEWFADILERYNAFRAPLRFSAQDIDPAYRKTSALLAPADTFRFDDWYEAEKQHVGSNNWVISGKRSQSGFPILANDPHRAQSIPSLRYWVHLHAPGWNVIGAGEPSLPGISIGHNEHGAWGLTIFETDSEDLYVYDTNPANPLQYKYQGKWVSMNTITETIAVKGEQPEVVTLHYTRHGPVVFEDKVNHKAYAVRAAWLEKGCSPYLASLRMCQATSWATFRAACEQSRIPGENMIWADKKGNIGYQAVGISPVRPNWSGLVPVPGDGRYEWKGYLPIKLLPNRTNPSKGYVVTANNNQITADFPYRNAVGWRWANGVRAQRIASQLEAKTKHSIADFMQLQTDYFSVIAQQLVPLLKPLSAADKTTEASRKALLDWDFRLDKQSVPAAIYVAWERQLKAALYQKMVPEVARPYMLSVLSKKMQDWLLTPPSDFGTNRAEVRDQLLISCLEKAVNDLRNRLGDDVSKWQYGQDKNKHIQLKHVLSNEVKLEIQQQLNSSSRPRGGYGETVGNTGDSYNQEHGASFRIIVDTANWDKTVGINNPGQSGDPSSSHYKDLFELWANDGYFPVYFSKSTIQSNTEKKFILSK
ncbi:MAG: penicillin acylase family protein [Spirosomataceae bacterium]